MSRPLSLLLLLSLLLVPLVASAHKESDAYLKLQTDASNQHLMRGQWDISLRDLDYAIGLDTNHDGEITWGELRARRHAIDAYALPRLTIKGDGLTCDTQPTGLMVNEHTDGAYAVVLFSALCDKNIPSKLTIDYRLMYDLDPYHRGIVTIRAGDKTAGAVVGPMHPTASLQLGNPDRWSEFKSFLVDGIWHIWTGLDHVLFLLSLLLPAVLVLRRLDNDGPESRGRWRARAAMAESTGAMMAMRLAPSRYVWRPVDNLWAACLDVIKIVTAFSIAHSITLTLAVLGLVSVPSRLVESGIALSVMLAALNNVYPLVNKRIWIIAFAFGLIHGLGFASALTGLDLPAGAMAASLGGFSLGVEIGQEAIVLAFLPLAYLARHTRFYRIYLLRGGSVLIVLIAICWLIQRALDVVIPGFGAFLPN